MEKVLQEVGHCGRFQVYHVTLVQACRFVTAWAQALMMFGLYNPGWRCVSTNFTFPRYVNDSNQLLNSSEPMPTFSRLLMGTDGNRSYNAREGFRTTWDVNTTTDDHLQSSNSFTSSCDVINSCDSIVFNPASSTVVSRFGLVCDKVWIAYLIVSILNGGMLTGAFVGGQVGERFGRKVGLYLCNSIMALSCGVAIFSPTWEVYAFFTFFIGLGSVGVITTMPSLCMEFINSKWRARISSIPVWNISLVLFAVTTYLLRDWKLIHLAAALLCSLTCLGFFWTPESLRWLIVHNKTSKAERVMEKISRLNKRPVMTEPLTEFVNSNDEAVTDRKYTYLDLLKTREIRVLTIKLSLIWVVTEQVYGIIGFGIQALPGDFYTNFILASLVEFPAVLLSGFLANKIGRRPTGILFTSVGILSCSTIVTSLFVMEEGDVRGHVISSFAFINRSSAQAVLCYMVPYSTELVPTAVRNLAFGFFNSSIRVTGIASAYLLPRDHVSMIICFAVLMVSQIAAVGLFFSLTETKGRPLNDGMNALKRNKTEMIF